MERAGSGPDPARAGGQKLRVPETRGKRLDRKVAKKVDLRRFQARRRSKYDSPLTSACVHPDAVTRGRMGGKVALGQFPAGVHLTPSNFPHHAMCRPRGQRSRHDVEPARQTNASDRHAAGTNGQTTGRSQAVECGGEAPPFEALFKASFGALNKASKADPGRSSEVAEVAARGPLRLDPWCDRIAAGRADSSAEPTWIPDRGGPPRMSPSWTFI